MNRSELLSELTQDALAYVMHGTFPESRFIGEIRPAGLDERFDDFESLVRLHFVLRPDVVRFVENLPGWLRSVKTQTKNISSRQHGQVSGRIDWQTTIRERYSHAPSDTSLFVCKDRTENYDIDENIVLKKILSIIYQTICDCEESLHKEYEWVTERWQDNLELVDVLRDIFERNVHIARIREPDAYEPTERMLRTAEESRNEVYREAARLFREYNEASAGNEEAIRRLLGETMITPDDDETLLELFVLFKYIGAIEKYWSEEFDIQTIKSGSQEIARMQGNDAELVLYHDQSGKDRGLSFVTAETDTPRSELSRAEMVKREAKEATTHYFQDEEVKRRTNRPDVIVLEIRKGDHREYLITEIKNSIREETIQRGIEETLEYVAFLRQDGEFVFYRETDFFGSGWNGLLVIQDLKSKDTRDLADQRSIRILQASEVEERLREVLESVVD